MSKENEFSLVDVEARDKARMLQAAKAAAKDSELAELLPKVGESRPGWLTRVCVSVGAWLRRPRSRLGVVLVVSACLVQGCATTAWHNYQVAEAQASEAAQIEAGLTPLVKTNADLIREGWFGYVVGVVLDAVVVFLGYRMCDDAQHDDEDKVLLQPVTNNYYNEPEPVEEMATAAPAE